MIRTAAAQAPSVIAETRGGEETQERQNGDRREPRLGDDSPDDGFEGGVPG